MAWNMWFSDASLKIKSFPLSDKLPLDLLKVCFLQVVLLHTLFKRKAKLIKANFSGSSKIKLLVENIILIIMNKE
jgi:hypothetical protein